MPLIPASSGDPHSIAHGTHSVSPPQPSPWTQCPHDNSNQRYSPHGASLRSRTLHPPTPSPPCVLDPYGGVLVDEDEDGCSEIVLVPGGRFLMTEHGGLSLWDSGLNTKEA